MPVELLPRASKPTAVDPVPVLPALQPNDVTVASVHPSTVPKTVGVAGATETLPQQTAFAPVERRT